MRLNTNKADKALYNYVRAVLGDLGEDGKSIESAGVGSAGGGVLVVQVRERRLL